MKVLFCVFLLTLAISAQNSGDYNKFEVGGNYSYQRIDKSGDFNNETGFKGFEVSTTFNISRYFGIKGDILGFYKKNDFNLRLIAPPQL